MTCGWNPRRGSEPAAVVLTLLLAAGALAAERLVPAPDAGEAWQRHAAADRAWAAGWPDAWPRWETPDAVEADTLAALLRSVGAVVAADRTPAVPVVPYSERLRDRWRSRGHLACTATLVRDDDHTALVVDPGPLFRVDRVTLAPMDDPALHRRLASLLPTAGEPCTAERWREAAGDVLRAAADAGRPFVRWRLQHARVDAERAVVDVEVRLPMGGAAVLGRVDSSLESPRARRFLARASGLQPGRVFRERDLTAARDRLRSRGLWLDVGEPVVWALRPDTVGVHWPVTSRPRPNRFAAVLGFSRDDEQKTRLSGQVELVLGNIAGTGRRLAVDWSDDGADRSHLGLAWLEPLVLGTPLDLEGLLDQEVLTDVHTRFQVDLRVRLPVAGAWGVELGLGRDRGTFPSGTWIRSSRWRTRAALDHRRLDPLRSGWAGSFAVESARRTAEVRPDSTGGVPTLLEERQTLVRLALDAELILTGATALGVRGGYAGVQSDARDLPLAEQERLGGARSLRGYREDQFPGDQVASAQLEVRLGKPGRSRLYTFLDLGYVRRATTAAGVTVTRPVGYGVGLETAGAGGDVSLAIGFPNSFGLDEAKLHVSLLRAF